MNGSVALIGVSLVGLTTCAAAAFYLAKDGWSAGPFFLIVYGVMYFVPPVYFAARALQGQAVYLEWFANADLCIDGDALPSVLALVFLLVYLVVYQFIRPAASPPDRAFEARTAIVLGARVQLPWALATIIGMVGLWGLAHYVEQYGGFWEAAAAATFVRAGAGREVQIGDSVFSYRFADVSFVVLAMAVSSTTWKRKVAATMLSLPFFVYVVVLAKGKANLLALALVPFLYLSLRRRKRLWKMALTLGVLALLVVPILQRLLFADLEGPAPGDGAVGESVIRYIAHPHLSVVASLHYPKGHLYLNDFVAGLAGQVLPSSWLLNVAPYSSIEINSEMISGVFERSIPPGPVAFGYYGAGLFGIVVWAAILAAACGMLDRLVRIASGNRAATFVVACLVFTISNGVYHGVPEYVFYFHRVVIGVLFLVAGYRVEVRALAALDPTGSGAEPMVQAPGTGTPQVAR